MKIRYLVLIFSILTALFVSSCWEGDITIDGENHHVVIEEGTTAVYGTAQFGTARWAK